MIFVPFPRLVFPTHVPLFRGAEASIYEQLRPVNGTRQHQASAQPAQCLLKAAQSHPFLKPAMARLIGGKLLGKILPASSRTQNPENPFHNGAISNAWATTFGAWLLLGKVATDLFPLLIGKFHVYERAIWLE